MVVMTLGEKTVRRLSNLSGATNTGSRLDALASALANLSGSIVEQALKLEMRLYTNSTLVSLTDTSPRQDCEYLELKIITAIHRKI